MESPSPLLSPPDSLAITHAWSWSVAAHGLGTWSHSIHIQPAFQVTLGVPPRQPSDAWFSAAPVRPAVLIYLLLGASCPHIGAARQPEGGRCIPTARFPPLAPPSLPQLPLSLPFSLSFLLPILPPPHPQAP